MIRIQTRNILLTIVVLLASPIQVYAIDFDNWLSEFKIEAINSGISEKTLQVALANIQPIRRVVELDKKQPEFTLTFEQYMGRVVSRGRVEKAKILFREHQRLLVKVGKKYAVQPRFLVALWGIETDFGRLTGGFNVIPALATLAYDGRRSKFFRNELLNALMIVDQGHIKSNDMRGSWAGAMGQVQFMPSSFLNFAVDYNGDGEKDIWTSLEDVFGSAANYLTRSGWTGDQTWGRAVTLPVSFDQTLIDYKNVRKSVSEWKTLGVRPFTGKNLSESNIRASLIKLKNGRVFLIYANYKVILKWNRSHFFALAVGHLADAIIDR